MDSDLSLLEASGEDDSLIPDDVALSSCNSSAYFCCSPLQRIPRLNPTVDCESHIAVPIERINGSKDTAEPNSLCNDGRQHSNKENVSVNDKHEIVKLSLEPQQMKRKKMGGGYNLRKSLAWDRAFFTEEGVLDPSELSMLSRSYNKFSGSLSLPIPEASCSQSHTCNNNNNNNNILSMDLNSSISNGRKKISSKLPKSSAAGDKIKRQVLTARDANRSVSKRSNSQQPIAASASLKRLGHVGASKMETKDSKASKEVAPKLDSSFVFSTTRSHSTNPGNSKIEITQAASNSQKSVGLGKSSTNTKSISDDVKPRSNAKQVRKAGVQLSHRSVVATSIPKRRLPAAENHLDCQEVIQELSIPASSIPTRSNNPRKIPASLPQNVSTCGNNVQKPEITKPSGLRMPTPSLGFFGQSKSCGVPRLLQRSIQPSNRPDSMIPKLAKSTATTPIQAGIPRSLAKKSIDSAKGHSSNPMMKSNSTLSSSEVKGPVSQAGEKVENSVFLAMPSSMGDEDNVQPAEEQHEQMKASSIEAIRDVDACENVQVGAQAVLCNSSFSAAQVDDDPEPRLLLPQEMSPSFHGVHLISMVAEQLDESGGSRPLQADQNYAQNEVFAACEVQVLQSNEDENMEMVNLTSHALSSDGSVLLDMQSNSNGGDELSGERRWSLVKEEAAAISVADNPLPCEDDAEVSSCDLAGSHGQCLREEEDAGDEEMQAVSNGMQDGARSSLADSSYSTLADDPNQHVIVEQNLDAGSSWEINEDESCLEDAFSFPIVACMENDKKNKVEFLNFFRSSTHVSIPDVHEEDEMDQKEAMKINCSSLEARVSMMDLKEMGEEDVAEQKNFSPEKKVDSLSDVQEEKRVREKDGQMARLGCVGLDHVADPEIHCGAGRLSCVGQDLNTAEFMNLNCRSNLSSDAVAAGQVKQSGEGGSSGEEVDKKHHFPDEIDDLGSLAAPGIQPKPGATPFSDEWLAAFEAAGEQVLAMKGGAVQNSPSEKPVPELGPWSPVCYF